jgi:hypothetical protein
MVRVNKPLRHSGLLVSGLNSVDRKILVENSLNQKRTQWRTVTPLESNTQSLAQPLERSIARFHRSRSGFTSSKVICGRITTTED